MHTLKKEEAQKVITNITETELYQVIDTIEGTELTPVSGKVPIFESVASPNFLNAKLILFTILNKKVYNDPFYLEQDRYFLTGFLCRIGQELKSILKKPTATVIELCHTVLVECLPELLLCKELVKPILRSSALIFYANVIAEFLLEKEKITDEKEYYDFLKVHYYPHVDHASKMFSCLLLFEREFPGKIPKVGIRQTDELILFANNNFTFEDILFPPLTASFFVMDFDSQKQAYIKKIVVFNTFDIKELSEMLAIEPNEPLKAFPYIICVQVINIATNYMQSMSLSLINQRSSDA